MYTQDRAVNITSQIAALLKSYEPIFKDAPDDIRTRFSQLTCDAVHLNVDVIRSAGGDSHD